MLPRGHLKLATLYSYEYSELSKNVPSTYCVVSLDGSAAQFPHKAPDGLWSGRGPPVTHIAGGFQTPPPTTMASDPRDGDCLDSSGAVCELMFKKPRSLYEVALMSVAGSLVVVVLLKAAFAFGFG